MMTSDEWDMDEDPWIYPTTEGPRLVGMTRNQCNAYIAEAEERGKRAERERIKARLREPDEAMVEAVGQHIFSDWSWKRRQDEYRPKIASAIRVIADTLEETDG